MAFKALKNHPTKKLRSDAADSLNRLEAKYGLVTVNSALRTRAEQQALINRWNRGGPANRPPYLYEPASLAKATHINGEAFDTSDIAKMLRVGADHGFVRTHLYDKVHFRYFPEKDKYRGQSAPAGGATKGSEKTKREQAFLNQYRGEKLVTDGKRGPATVAANKRYQNFLKKNWGYKGVVDGNWGTGTQASHSKYYASLKKGTTPPKVAGFSQTTKNQQTFLILKRREKIAADGKRGPATIAAFKRYQQFLKKSYGYRGGIDGVWGPGMQAAHAKYYAKVK
jgi:peptidoglycan hydrolase-like protein with peptidoglycan-binding domain